MTTDTKYVIIDHDGKMPECERKRMIAELFELHKNAEPRIELVPIINHKEK